MTVAFPFLAAFTLGLLAGLAVARDRIGEWRRLSTRLARALRWHDDGSDEATVAALAAYDAVCGDVVRR